MRVVVAIVVKSFSKRVVDVYVVAAVVVGKFVSFCRPFTRDVVRKILPSLLLTKVFLLLLILLLFFLFLLLLLLLLSL